MFTVYGSHYLQISGCAMGTVYAPVYAHIFMAQFEAKYRYLYIHHNALLFLKYIDDMSMIWKRNREELILFIDDLNKKDETINFDHKIST